MAYDEALAKRLLDYFHNGSDLEVKKMFGQISRDSH